jgi:tripartite-type tricarboxylate transporter receptor subunit TctC
MQEAGLPGFRSVTWFGLVAPPGTPAPLAARINRDTVAILKSRDVDEKLRELRLDPGATSPEETAAYFAEETKLWSEVIKAAHVSVQ